MSARDVRTALVGSLRNINWMQVGFTAVLLAFLAWLHLRLYQYPFDDAYIHFRVARNLFETGKPYFNLYEALKVSTSSPWIVLLAILFGITHILQAENQFPLLVGVGNALLLTWATWTYIRIVELLLNRRLPLAAMAYFSIPFVAIMMPSGIGLMETPLAIMLAGLGIYYLLLSRPLGLALLALAAYTRPELLILLVLAALLAAIQHRYPLRDISVCSLFPLVIFAFFDLWFFHTVVPHSIIAKNKVYSLPTLTTLQYLSRIIPVSLEASNRTLLLAGVIVFGTMAVCAWAILGGTKTAKTPWLMLFCLWTLGIMTAYALGHAFVFPWYGPLYAVPVLIACFFGAFSFEYPARLFANILLFIMVLMSAVSISRTGYASLGAPSAFILFDTGSRVKTYLLVGRTLNDEYPHGTLLTSEIGALGYSFQGPILDADGLASSAALAFHPMKVPEQRASGIIGAIPPGYVRLSTPDIIVSYDIFAEALLESKVIKQYNLVSLPAYLPEDAIHSVSKTIFGSRYLRIYIRKTLPISEKLMTLGQ